MSRPRTNTQKFTSFACTVALAIFATSALRADEPKKTDGADNPGNASKADVKPGGIRTIQAAGAQATPVQPTTPGLPEPTVQLKPGEMPKIQFDTPNFDFGRLRSGDEVVHDFWFTNTGNGTLEILRVKPSCGCTSAGEPDRIVEPGQTGKIPLKLSTAKMNGAITKTVIVNTNIEGADSQVTLRISGNVWQPLELKPAFANFGRIQPDQLTADARIQKVTLSSNVDAPVNADKFTVSSEAFAVKITPVVSGKQFEIAVTLNDAAGLKPGLNRETITIETGVEEAPSIELPISVFITSDVEVTPPDINFFASNSQPIKRRLYVRNNKTEALAIKAVESSNPEVKAVVEEMSAGMTYRITVDFPANYKPAEGDQIEIRTNNERYPSVIVPIKQQTATVSPVNPAMTPTAIRTTATPKAAPAVANTPEATKGEKSTTDAGN